MSLTILIASQDLLPGLKERTADIAGEVLAFTDSDALRALDAITKRHPETVALERQFASTPRGAAFINRIKADPALVGCEVVLISEETDFSRLPKGRPQLESSSRGTASPAAVATATPPATKPLDQTGTRRAQRFKIAGRVNVLIDGNNALLVDLSIIGAQVVSSTVMKPNQRVRVSLSDEEGTIRVRASVAWASFEIPSGGNPRYRAGLEFADASAESLEPYCTRHRV